VIARRRGRQWFVGAITNNDAREVTLPLTMLMEGQRYSADLYLDGDGPRDVRKQQRTVTRDDVLRLSLQARGGAALVLTPQ